ncbi:hypothetical protein QFC22_002942 [Naganishia vaughanmartiniae]|uniref:Uncharacterized protein n=1 Tax=Naganishia vaughanmartiniae TaxID=1424756 RepID=A0ACC2X9I4_9TREE|nr:hypothetical protein QFC22_002942 [Naganishia vaughanmartiniae]
MLRASRTLRNAFSASGLEPLAGFVGAGTGDAFAAGGTGKFLPPVFNRIVLDAAIAKPPSPSTSSEEAQSQQPTTIVRARNPFIPHRNAQTGRYAPPKISLRRQADLAKIYPSEYLPAGLKNRTGKSGRSGRVQTIQYEEDRLTVQWVGKVKPLRTATSSASTSPTTNEALLSGPYTGRQHQPTLFKGHKHERVRVERKEETKSRMEGMENRIADWRKVRTCSCLSGLYCSFFSCFPGSIGFVESNFADSFFLWVAV